MTIMTAPFLATTLPRRYVLAPRFWRLYVSARSLSVFMFRRRDALTPIRFSAETLLHRNVLAKSIVVSVNELVLLQIESSGISHNIKVKFSLFITSHVVEQTFPEIYEYNFFVSQHEVACFFFL